VAIQALTVISLGSLADDREFEYLKFTSSVRLIPSTHSSARLRKSLLLGFAGLGSLASFLFLVLPSSSILWPLSALLAIAANVSFGVSMVCLNSYLPRMARNDQDILKIPVKGRSSESIDESRGLLNGDEACEDSVSHGAEQDAEGQEGDAVSSEAYAEAMSRATARISSKGIAIGYSAGIALLLVLIIPVTLLKGSTFSLRLAIG
jgi:UMF1 family MFS transporter